MSITARALATLTPGAWLTEAGNRNEGALRAKGGPNGARLYYRYRDTAGRYDDLPLGTFDEKGKRGLTLAQARERVRQLRDRYLTGARDLRAALEADDRERQRQREAEERAEEVAKVRAAATLEALLAGYVAQLRRDNKPSAREVERTLHNHVKDAWPKLWRAPAEQVTTDDLLAVVARVANADKLREAAKLRSYLSAAYASAIRARQDARGLPALRDLKITHNPARDLVTIDGASKARERALSVAELRAYWQRIAALPDPAGALLRFHLLTGGQRIEQLGRLTRDDYDTDLEAVRIRDGKGRRKVARIHDVPLIPAAADALRAMGQQLGPYLFTVTAGESGAVYATVQHRVRAVVDAMEKAGELEKGPFTVGDLRRTVETRLSAAGVQPSEMAQLQSHGLGGVQQRHYNKHKYLEEKRAALETLHRLLTGERGTVTAIKRKSN
jgi:hypothetical protein